MDVDGFWMDPLLYDFMISMRGSCVILLVRFAHKRYLSETELKVVITLGFFDKVAMFGCTYIHR